MAQFINEQAVNANLFNQFLRRTRFIDYTPNKPPHDEDILEYQSRVERTVIIPGDLRTRFIAYVDFRGLSTVVTVFNQAAGKNVKFISRLNPDNYVPDGGGPFTSGQQGKNYLWCTRVAKTEGVGPGGTDLATGLPNFATMRVTLEYSTPPWVILDDSQVLARAAAGNFRQSPLFDATAGVGFPDEGQALGAAAGAQNTGERMIVRYNRPSSKILTVPKGLMRFPPIGAETAPTAAKEGLPLEEVRIDLRYQWVQVPVAGYPLAAMINCLNNLNDAQFDGYPAGTLMLRSIDPKFYTHFGDWYADIEYGMTFAGHANQGAQLFGAASATIAVGGTGGAYAVGDNLTASGGTDTKPAIFTVATQAGGVVGSVTVKQGGSYTVVPGNPVATTSDNAGGGNGTGCTLNVTWTTLAPGGGAAGGWNFFVGTGANNDLIYRLMTASGLPGGQTAFRLVDFTTLFRPTQP